MEIIILQFSICHSKQMQTTQILNHCYKTLPHDESIGPSQHKQTARQHTKKKQPTPTHSSIFGWCACVLCAYVCARESYLFSNWSTINANEWLPALMDVRNEWRCVCVRERVNAHVLINSRIWFIHYALRCAPFDVWRLKQTDHHRHVGLPSWVQACACVGGWDGWACFKIGASDFG